ncbi:hypothetical protein ACG0Z6_02660 [Roseateles sp. BYS180W]|uniref:IcmF-related N-terminal domain-containing protein n=1 Tax=Roseateles rivi TaxID=3299028 RepID=A0ABW7FS29_9BURK
MGWLRGLGLLVAVTCVVWVAVLWHWQGTHRDMSVEDILIYLGALPLTLFALLLAARWAWQGVEKRLTAPEPAANPAETPAAAPTLARPPKAMRVLGAYVTTPAGDTVGAMLDAAEKNDACADLSDTLYDAEGLPVMVSCVPELSTDALTQELEALNTDKSEHPEPSAALLRALSLLEAPLQQAAEALGAWHEAQAPVSQAAPRLHVRVLAAWPQFWNAAELQVAQTWLQSRLHKWGSNVGLPPSLWLMQPSAAALPLWSQVERLADALRHERLGDALLVLATHSDVCEQRIQALDDVGQLFNARRPKGLIPGEAACAMVLDEALLSQPAAGAEDTPWLYAAALQQRDKSVDAPGRIGAKWSTAVLEQAMLSRTEAPSASCVVNDADHHSPRGAEMFAAMHEKFPDLDAAQDQRMLGPLLGHVGAVAPLLVLASAAELARQSTKPCMALSVSDPLWRLAALAEPSPQAVTASTPSESPNAA